MPSEKESGALREILRNIKLTEQFTQGHTSATLEVDEKTLYAVVQSLEIISEASRRLTDELKARHPNIEWHEMAAAGNGRDRQVVLNSETAQRGPIFRAAVCVHAWRRTAGRTSA